MLERYDTIGIDCVAMNVNDVICVGAEPIALVDYIAIERADAGDPRGARQGAPRGRRQAGVTILGGEIAQVREIIGRTGPGQGLDLVGSAPGSCRSIASSSAARSRPGDVVVGRPQQRASTATGSRWRAGRFRAGQARRRTATSPGSGGTLGEELLRPTHIYVQPGGGALLEAGRAGPGPGHITGDGLLNLARIDGRRRLRDRHLPPPPPIFDLIQTTRQRPGAEMYRVFNMGIGFCLVVGADGAGLRAVTDAFGAHGFETHVIGRVIADERKRVFLPEQKLVGEGDRFDDL